MNGGWEYPYDIVTYYTLKEKWIKKNRLNYIDVFEIEKLVLEMTHAMKWLSKYLEDDKNIAGHDYYEIVDFRKAILEVLKKYRKKDYKLFIQNNPKVLDYVGLREKKPKL